MELRATVRVGTDSSAAAGMAERSRTCGYRKKVRSLELRISRVTSEDNRVD